MLITALKVLKVLRIFDLIQKLLTDLSFVDVLKIPTPPPPPKKKDSFDPCFTMHEDTGIVC